MYVRPLIIHVLWCCIIGVTGGPAGQAVAGPIIWAEEATQFYVLAIDTLLCMGVITRTRYCPPTFTTTWFVHRQGEAYAKCASSTSGPRKYNFPGRSFGSKGESRSFKAAWFDNWSRLYHQEMSDSVLCSCANSRNLLAKELYGNAWRFMGHQPDTSPDHPTNHCNAYVYSCE